MKRTYKKHNRHTDRITMEHMLSRGNNSMKATAKKIRQAIFRETGKRFSEASIVNRYYRLRDGVNEKVFMAQREADLKAEQNKYAVSNKGEVVPTHQHHAEPVEAVTDIVRMTVRGVEITMVFK